MNSTSKKALVIFGLFIFFILLMRFSGIAQYLNLKNFVHNRNNFLQSVDENYFFSLIVYLTSYIVVVISTLPLAGLLTIMGGFLFGFIPGTFFAVIGGTIGSVLSVLLLRHVLGRFVQKKYKERLEKFNKNIERFGIFYVLMMQLVGVIPFFIVNILVSFTRIRISKFAWVTAVGIIPINIIYAYAGRQLGTINNVSEIFSPKVVTALILLALLSLIPLIFKKLKLAKY